MTLDRIGATPTEGGGAKINGLTFTGVKFNGCIAVISDKLPVKSKNGREVHWFEMRDPDPLTGEVEMFLLMSQKMFDSIMTDGEIEAFRLKPLAGG